ncbi:MAG: ABC transporter permease subunit [Chloroflexi bacterium]|nr:ABC transporter permease subunit [Chloroflexota bacterium]
MNAPSQLQQPQMYRVKDWMRTHLFNGTGNTILTVLVVLIAGFVLFTVIRFVFIDAEWSVVSVNKRLIFLGRYPKGEEWRLWPPLWAALGLIAAAWGTWSSLSRRDILWLLLAAVFILVFVAHGTEGLLFGGAVVLAAVLYAGVRLSGTDPTMRSRLRLAIIIGWIILLPGTIVIITAFDGVQPALWGGLMLNILLATFGIGFALPLGIALALARSSSLPVVKWFSTAIIEITRGGPLVAWLFIARFVLPAFLPDILNTDVIVNALIIVILFTGAYIAEIVRGGLQSVPPGQREAADALGLSGFNVTVFIILPQALKAVIPALVSQMISLWKDTTLFSILSFTDALGGAKAAFSQAQFVGRQKEALIFIGLIFWAGSFGMSRISRRIEKYLGVGSR